MKPVKFEGHNIILGKGQPEYLELPVLRCNCDYGTTWSCWELDDADIEDLVKHRRLWIGQLSFHLMFQPQMVTTVMPAEVSIASYKLREEAKQNCVYKFYRPEECTGYGYGADGLKYRGVLRYAEGRWLPDDGEPDLAFIGYTLFDSGKGGAPIYYGVDVGYFNSFHPNAIANKSASDKCCEINNCASGIFLKPEECNYREEAN